LKKILPLFSYVFHPIFISLYGTLFYFGIAKAFDFSVPMLYLTIIQVIILTVLLPIALYFLLYSLKIVKSFTEATIKERRLPIAIQAILLFILLKFSVSLDYTVELYYFFLGGFYSAVLALFAILVQHKSSLHMMGISALTSFIYCISLANELPLLFILILSIICMGFVASSRLFMKSHTPFELITGTGIGMLPQLVIWNQWL